MSSGACRALVAVLLTLVATIVMTLPVIARSSDLNEASTVTYTVDPSDGTISVRTSFTLITGQEDWPARRWGPIVVENQASYRIIFADRAQGTGDVPGPGAPWKHINVRTSKIEGGQNAKTFRVRADIEAQIGDVADDLPARVDESYVFLCITGQDTDTGKVTIKIAGKGWEMDQSGTVMDPTASGFVWSGGNPGDLFTCIEATRDRRLQKSTLIGPAERNIELQGWKEDGGWNRAAETRSAPALDKIHLFLGHDIPGEADVIVRESPPREAGGYASAHDTPGVVQVDERVTATEVDHQMAHAWFGRDNVQELWLREGMAEWIASAVSSDVCEAATTNDPELELDLSEWLVVQPNAPENYKDIIEAQQAAACGIVSAVSARMPDETWRNDVLSSLLRGETKYIGTAGPEVGTSTLIDFKEWLDAVDERGLVPAAKSDPAYADNRTDLDFAQNLLDEFGVPNDVPQLQRRSEARATYHQFLDDAAPLGAPHAVRKDMDDWNFESAMKRIQKSYDVLANLIEADRLLPEADLLPIVQPQFEAAKDEAELDDVSAWAASLLEGARGVAVPLGDLQSVLPLGWKMPEAVTAAIADQRFDDIMSSITPAIEAAQQISAANEYLPQAGLLDKYQARYENTVTASKLEELTGDAATDSRDAERAGFALALLQNEIGDWTIPDAVTRPLEQGQLKTGLAIVEDARAVVAAAREADLAVPEAGLREEIQPLFEGVTTGAEMAVLREQVETRRDDAVSVGEALSTLARLVPDWQIPAVIEDPVAAGDFAAAVDAAAAAQAWIEDATAANESLPEINALGRIQQNFENAADLAELQAGADLAADWKQAADQVRLAIDVAAEPRDMLTTFGLWGVNVDPLLAEAKEAAITGNVGEALGKSAEVIQTIQGGSGSGSLRLAGIVFFGVAVIGVAGLWLMLRRQAGPSWARSTTPHWVDGENKRGLLGRGKDKDKDQKS
jgi:hypothetical protein